MHIHRNLKSRASGFVFVSRLSLLYIYTTNRHAMIYEKQHQKLHVDSPECV